MDDLITPQSIEGSNFPDLEILGAEIASALKRSTSEEELVLKSRPLKKTPDFCEEDRLLFGSMTIFEQLVLKMQLLTCQIFSKKKKSQGDDIQDVDATWDQAF